MAQPAPARPKINTKPTQPWDASGPGVSRRPARGSTRVRGEVRESARGRAVIELDAGITVYPLAGERGPVAGGLGRGRPPAVLRGGNRGETGRPAGEDHRATRGRRAGYGTSWRRPDRLVPVTRPATRRRAVVPQARPHSASAVRAVRVPGHREHGVPGHPGRRHAAGRQSRVDGTGRRSAPCPGLGSGRGRYPRRIPGQRPAEGGALASRPEPAHGRAEGDRGRGVAAVRRSRRDPRARRCRQTRPGPRRARFRGV